MNPNSPNPQPAGQFDSSQFDFIMNPAQPPKRSLLPSGPSQKLLIFVIGGITLITIILIGLVSIFSSSSPAIEQLTLTAQQQQEIIRVSALGSTRSKGIQAKKLAAITNSVLTTDQASLVAYLGQQGAKVDSKQLRLLEDKKTDDELAVADSNGRYDEVFTRILLEKLREYQKHLQETHGQISVNGKEIIKKSYDNATLILKDNDQASQ